MRHSTMVVCITATMILILWGVMISLDNFNRHLAVHQQVQVLAFLDHAEEGLYINVLGRQYHEEQFKGLVRPVMSLHDNLHDNLPIDHWQYRLDEQLGILFAQVKHTAQDMGAWWEQFIDGETTQRVMEKSSEIIIEWQKKDYDKVDGR